MKNKYELTEVLEHVDSGEKLTVIDFEFINGEHYYYFDGYKCFPENQLKKAGFGFLKRLLTTSKVEKERQRVAAFKQLDTLLAELNKSYL